MFGDDDSYSVKNKNRSVIGTGLIGIPAGAAAWYGGRPAWETLKRAYTEHGGITTTNDLFHSLGAEARGRVVSKNMAGYHQSTDAFDRLTNTLHGAFSGQGGQSEDFLSKTRGKLDRALLSSIKTSPLADEAAVAESLRGVSRNAFNLEDYLSIVKKHGLQEQFARTYEGLGAAPKGMGALNLGAKGLYPGVKELPVLSLEQANLSAKYTNRITALKQAGATFIGVRQRQFAKGALSTALFQFGGQNIQMPLGKGASGFGQGMESVYFNRQVADFAAKGGPKPMDLETYRFRRLFKEVGAGQKGFRERLKGLDEQITRAQVYAQDPFHPQAKLNRKLILNEVVGLGMNTSTSAEIQRNTGRALEAGLFTGRGTSPDVFSKINLRDLMAGGAGMSTTTRPGQMFRDTILTQRTSGRALPQGIERFKDPFTTKQFGQLFGGGKQNVVNIPTIYQSMKADTSLTRHFGAIGLGEEQAFYSRDIKDVLEARRSKTFNVSSKAGFESKAIKDFLAGKGGALEGGTYLGLHSGGKLYGTEAVTPFGGMSIEDVIRTKKGFQVRLGGASSEEFIKTFGIKATGGFTDPRAMAGFARKAGISPEVARQVESYMQAGPLTKDVGLRRRQMLEAFHMFTGTNALETGVGQKLGAALGNVQDFQFEKMLLTQSKAAGMGAEQIGLTFGASYREVQGMPTAFKGMIGAKHFEHLQRGQSIGYGTRGVAEGAASKFISMASVEARALDTLLTRGGAEAEFGATMFADLLHGPGSTKLALSKTLLSAGDMARFPGTAPSAIGLEELIQKGVGEQARMLQLPKTGAIPTGQVYIPGKQELGMLAIKRGDEVIATSAAGAYANLEKLSRFIGPEGKLVGDIGVQYEKAAAEAMAGLERRWMDIKPAGAVRGMVGAQIQTHAAMAGRGPLDVGINRAGLERLFKAEGQVASMAEKKYLAGLKESILAGKSAPVFTSRAPSIGGMTDTFMNLHMVKDNLDAPVIYANEIAGHIGRSGESLKATNISAIKNLFAGDYDADVFNMKLIRNERISQRIALNLADGGVQYKYLAEQAALRASVSDTLMKSAGGRLSMTEVEQIMAKSMTESQLPKISNQINEMKMAVLESGLFKPERALEIQGALQATEQSIISSKHGLLHTNVDELFDDAYREVVQSKTKTYGKLQGLFQQYGINVTGEHTMMYPDSTNRQLQKQFTTKMNLGSQGLAEDISRAMKTWTADRPGGSLANLYRLGMDKRSGGVRPTAQMLQELLVSSNQKNAGLLPLLSTLRETGTSFAAKSRAAMSNIAEMTKEAAAAGLKGGKKPVLIAAGVGLAAAVMMRDTSVSVPTANPQAGMRGGSSPKGTHERDISMQETDRALPEGRGGISPSYTLQGMQQGYRIDSRSQVDSVSNLDALIQDMRSRIPNMTSNTTMSDYRNAINPQGLSRAMEDY